MTMSIFKVNYVYETLNRNWVLGRAFINAIKGSDLYGLVHTKDLKEIAQSMAFGDTTVLFNGMLFLSDGRWIKASSTISKGRSLCNTETTVNSDVDYRKITSNTATSKKNKNLKKDKPYKKSFEVKILDVIKRNKGMKTVEIAAELGCSISKINYYIFGSLKNKLYYDDSYHWHIKD